jgi:hypothetical protein
MHREHRAHEEEHEHQLEMLEDEPPGAVERRLAKRGNLA